MIQCFKVIQVMKNRSQLREIIMKVIYQVLILRESHLEVDVPYLIKEQLEVENEFVTSVVFGILEKEEEMTALANKYLKDWQMDRLNKVDQAIILLGIYELLYTETPSVVAINEAVELSKRYSDEKVTKMINAILDGIFKSEEEKEEA